MGGPAGSLGGGRKRQTDRQNGALPVCGGTIGHRPLRGRCPKKEVRRIGIKKLGEDMRFGVAMMRLGERKK